MKNGDLWKPSAPFVPRPCSIVTPRILGELTCWCPLARLEWIVNEERGLITETWSSSLPVCLSTWYAQRGWPTFQTMPWRSSILFPLFTSVFFPTNFTSLITRSVGDRGRGSREGKGRDEVGMNFLMSFHLPAMSDGNSSINATYPGSF